MSTAYGYYTRGRMTTEQHSNAGISMTYVNTYDAADRIQTETRNGFVRTFGYDGTGQVTSDSAGSGTSYTYDKNGNRTSGGSSTGVANRLATDGTWTYTYDFEGNVATKTRISDGRYWSYGYDHRNQMTSAVEKTSASGTVVDAISLYYDVYGNAVAKDVDGTLTGYAFEITDTRPGCYFRYPHCTDSSSRRCIVRERKGDKGTNGGRHGKGTFILPLSTRSAPSTGGRRASTGDCNRPPPEIGQQWLGAEECFWAVAMLRAGEFLRGLEYDRSALAGRSKDSRRFAEVRKSLRARKSFRRIVSSVMDGLFAVGWGGIP